MMTTSENLPASGVDVLNLPDATIPDVLQGLIRNKALSGLMQSIHADMKSTDPSLRSQAELALKKLGFPS